MLILGRKKKEQIIIDGSIQITVLDVRGDRVKLGFVAPIGVPIHRAEVYRRLASRKDDSELMTTAH